MMTRAGNSETGDCDAVHPDGLNRVVVPGLDLRDLHSYVHPLGDLAEDWVLGLSWREPVEIPVVGDIHEELRSTRVFLASVGHGQSSRRIAVPGDVFVLDVATIEALFRGTSLQVLEGTIFGPASARPP